MGFTDPCRDKSRLPLAQRDGCSQNGRMAMSSKGASPPVKKIGLTELRPTAPATWEIAQTGAMQVPGRIFASDELLDQANVDKALLQVANVAHLPGIVTASFGMPDVHPGYGFPIGGVAATAVDGGGVVSPGGVGFDIGCGVRLLASSFTLEDFRLNGRLIMDRLAKAIPRGSGPGSVASGDYLPAVLRGGAPAAVDAGFGRPADVELCEQGGWFSQADPAQLSVKAKDRGRRQIGSLGGGNHFLEVQVVDRVVHPDAARAFGLEQGRLCIMIHCGSRGLGHQVCSDALREAAKAMARYHLSMPDRQLASVPVDSAEGAAYLGAMWSAANFALANRQVLANEVRRVFASVFDSRTDTVPIVPVYDVLHNMASLESHAVDGEVKQLCVHRKGATPARGADHGELPMAYRAHGQPVLLPGSMGTSSWVLLGVNSNPAFSSAPHGAGRLMSRTGARRLRSGRQVFDEMTESGILVRPKAVNELSEEAPYAYKNVSEVVDVSSRTGLALPVAELRPLGVVKG